MPEATLLDELVRAITDLDEAGALTLVQTRLARGGDPFEIVAACQAGLRRVGELYEVRQYYLSGLIMAGEIFREIVELLRPALEQRTAEPAAGRILLGTVQGDIHDIGKNMLGMLLTSHGFAVTDLGVDVPAAEFLRLTLAVQPDVICLSALISSSHESMRATVALLKTELAQRGLTVPIMIGGGLMDEHIFRYVGADHWAGDAMEGVRLCRDLSAARRPAAG
ncbi:MAG: cobalamin-dependent protein [Anaerolineales bacterium]|nr:cobalamin-dependent protein [Anaerolineales bacterium]